MRRVAILSGILLLAAIVLARLLPGGVPAMAAEDGPSGAPKDAVAKGAAANGEAAKADAAKEAARTEAADAAAGGYAGDEACAACHDEIAASVARGPHTRGASSAWKGRACEGCHGPGQAHVDAGGGPVGIKSLKEPMVATERAGACLACHGSDPRMHDVRGGEHLLAGVACSGCHDPHGASTTSPLLRKPMPDLCMSCHLPVRAAFAMPYRHGPTQGRVDCGDCHEPHGGRGTRGMLRAPNDRTCFSCHDDKQGPWVFEHGGLVTEGCDSCHVPHGSANRHLLRYQQVAQLCYQCHTLTPRSHVQPTYRDCTRCHVWIHGSNTDPRFLEP